MRNFNYWCFVLAALFFIGCHRDSPKTIDIYSVAVGFQKESITQSGIAVSRFFYGLAPGTNEYNGVLFQIVAPEQFAGQYFWMLHDGYLASGDASLLYKPESVYKFPMAIGVARKDFHDIEYIRKLVCERDLFCLHPKGYYLNTLRPVGERIFASESEVSSEISRLQKIIDDRTFCLDYRPESLCDVLPVVGREILVRDFLLLKVNASVFHNRSLCFHNSTIIDFQSS